MILMEKEADTITLHGGEVEADETERWQKDGGKMAGSCWKDGGRMAERWRKTGWHRFAKEQRRIRWRFMIGNVTHIM